LGNSTAGDAWQNSAALAAKFSRFEGLTTESARLCRGMITVSLSIERASYFQYRHYPSALPLLCEGVDAKRHRVVIVGAGAVGLCLALGLARQGVASVLIEADDTVCVGSRAICISRRSLEVLAQLGLAREFLDLGLAWTGGRSYYRDREVFRLQMPHDENQRFPPMINLQQCFAEQFLVDAVQRRSDLIEMRWKTRVSAIEACEDRVRLDVETEQGSYALEGDWVVACDGAHSFVRRALGLRMQGTQYEGSYVIVDIELKSDYPTERRAWFDPPSNPGSTLLMHKQPLDIWRLDYQLRDAEDPEEAVKPENVIPRVASHLRMIGERDDWKLVWISMYRANALTLESYRHGRVLFAGDAAHLVPIFGVRGLNSGIEDAHNLAWKLAGVVKGRAGPGLLDSYSEERVYAAHENLRYATKSTEFMAPPSHAFSLMREAVLSLAPRHPWLQSLINPRQTGAIGFPRSPLNGPEQGAWRGGPRPGDPLPESALLVNEGGSSRPGFISELLGPEFTMLQFRDPACPDGGEIHLEPHAAARLTWRTISRQVQGAAAIDVSGRAFELYDADPGAFYLVRPDGHLLARWRTLQPAEIAGVLATEMGASA
jgi:3-(3-hydroxy-phenyl)propionate hydroxylase